VRAIATSGTTGKPKLALFDQRSIAQKIDNLTGVWGGAGREFNFMPLAATGGFSTALVSLLTGTPFLAKDTIKRALIDFLIENQVEVLAGSPDQISGFIDANRENLGLLSEIKQIRLAGSHPGPLFLEKVRSFFDVQITSVYGSTETGAIFTVEVDRDSELRAMGMLKPGAQARVVDDTGQPLPMDAEGFLETKSDSMYSGYLADKQDMSIQEPGEWFATSDMAKVTEAGFVFLGRPSAVLNIGGVKIAVDELEQFVKQLDGVDDALSFEAEDKMGQAIHVMAVVASSDEIVESLIEAVNSRFKSRAPKLFWKTEFIDRAGLDKPARWKARERFNSEYLTS
jgi:acyl-coenzyme A synthetase/AMP-(fatty) acid ligase